MTKKSNKSLIFVLVSGMSVFFLLSPVLNTYNGFKTDFNTNLHSIQVASTSLKLWNYTWGGSEDDCGYGVASDSLGNAYVTGYTANFGAGVHDIVLVKYDGNGVQQWNRTWGGGSYDRGRGVTVDSSGNVYLVGETYSFGAENDDIILVKFSPEGIKQWNYTWGGSQSDYGKGVASDSSGNVYVTGVTGSFGAGGLDIFLVKFSPEGIKQWNYTWGGIGNDYGNGVCLDSSGNVYVTGMTRSFGAGKFDLVLVKFNPEGIQQWNYTWGGSGDDIGMGVCLDSLRNVYVVGDTASFGASKFDLVLVKVSPEGINQWNYTWGRSQDDYGHGVALDSLGNAYVTGYTASLGAGNNDIFLVKFSPEGINQWNYIWGGSQSDIGMGVCLDSSGNVYIAGKTASFGAGNNDIILVKFSPDKSEDGQPFPILIPIVITVSVVGVLAVGVIYIYLRRK